MASMSSEQEREALRKLQEAFMKHKSRCTLRERHKAELKYAGNNSGRSALYKTKQILKEAHSFLNNKVIKIDRYFKKEYPETYQYTKNASINGISSIKTAYIYARLAAKIADLPLHRGDQVLYDNISVSIKKAADEIVSKSSEAIKYVNKASSDLENEFSRKYPKLKKILISS